MNVFASFSRKRTGPGCQNCIHFQNDPAQIEAVYPGLTVLSSGFASVRDRDGLCTFHQIYLSAGDSCPHIEVEQLSNTRP